MLAKAVSTPISIPVTKHRRRATIPCAFKPGKSPPTREPDVLDTLLDAIATANDECALGPSSSCAAAWDVVQDITTGLHKVRERDFRGPADPLDVLCAEKPWAVECRAYDV